MWHRIASERANLPNPTRHLWAACRAPSSTAVVDWLKNLQTNKSCHGDIQQWDMSRITRLNSTFEGENVRRFNSNINTWDVKRVTNMDRTFAQTTKFNQDLDDWNVSGVTTMHGLFAYAKAFNSRISSWSVGKVRCNDVDALPSVAAARVTALSSHLGRCMVP